MPNLSNESIRKLRDVRDTADRYASIPPQLPNPPPLSDKPSFLIGRIDSGPDGNGKWTGRLVKYDVFTSTWISSSEWDMKFLPAVPGQTLTVGVRYPCRQSHIDTDGFYVFDTFLSGASSTFVVIDSNLGTGTHNLQGRSVGRIATYNVANDEWSYLPGGILIELLNTNQELVEGVRYPAWYAGEATGGFDGTGTGTLGTGTSSTVSVYIAEGDYLIEVVTNVTVYCVSGNIVTTQTKKIVRTRGLVSG